MPLHLRAPLAAALGAGALLICSAPALAQSGETLKLAVDGPSVAGQVTTVTASGVDADPSFGGYNLDVYAKPTAVDPTCAPTDELENQAWANDMAYEFHPVVGAVETIDPGPFSVTFKDNFEHPGTQLLCAYTYGDPGEVPATLTVDVQPAPGSGAPAPAAPAAPGAPAAKPAFTRPPRVARSGRRLVCRRGAWTGATSFRYRWVVGRHARHGAHGRRLPITRALAGRSIRCGVTASNAAGATSALSAPLRVR
jgi:hypothetical protein